MTGSVGSRTADIFFSYWLRSCASALPTVPCFPFFSHILPFENKLEETPRTLKGELSTFLLVVRLLFFD
jgi:hypothetical protein